MRGTAAGNLALVVALAVASLVPQFGGNGVQLGQLPLRENDAWAVVLILGQSLPLALRRRWPMACLTVVACSFAMSQTIGYEPALASVGLFVALYSAGAYARRHRRASAVVITAGYVVLAVTLHGRHSPESPSAYVTFYVALVACWAAGAWMRGWRAGEAERHLDAARQAITQERARIARELHDVVTHHVTAIVVQADAAQYLLRTAPDGVTDTLTAISGTGRQTLEELRHLLGVLDDPATRSGDRVIVASAGADRRPVLGRLHELVEQMRLAGQPVDLFEDGERGSIAAGPELAVYRVVQEALTNALKHASGRRTTVRVDYGDEIRVEVTTEGPRVAAGTFRAGRGLTGLRERVSASGGELTAGHVPGGGFSVCARIPSGWSS